MVHTELVVRPLIDTKTGIFCHMIEFGGSKIVVDCGIDETFDYSLYDGCFQEIQGADCILITTFSLAHMGAVGLFFEKPIYCAVPTTVLGQIVIRDCSDKYNSFYGKSINTRVNSIQIKFSQPFKVNDVEICAFNAGCCAGNSLFRISYGMLSIMVGYDLNQRKVNYSDGLDIELLRGSSVLITNSAYARVPSYTIKGRNQMLYDIIRGCDGKVLIVVQFFHLIELLSIISKEKIIVVSRHGKLFVDRLKSMVEWAGAQANDIFADLNVDFGKIEDLTDHNVVIVVTDVPGVSYLGTVLERFNQPENLLLLINREAEEIVFEKLPVCSFGYFVRKIKMSDSLAVSTIDNDNEEYDENTHWTMRTNAIFVKKLDRKSLFPHIQRKIHRSDYGETFDITMEKQSEAPIKENHDDEEEEIETASILHEGVAPRCMVKEFQMRGICDFESSRAVVDSLDLQHLVVVDDCGADSVFYCASFYGRSNGLRAHLCNTKTSILFNNVIDRSAFSEELSNLKYKTIKNKRVSKFIAERSGGLVEVKGDYSTMTIGAFTLLKLRKALIRRGLSVDIDEDRLIINENCLLTFNNSMLLISSSEDALLARVRSVVYEFVAII